MRAGLLSLELRAGLMIHYVFDWLARKAVLHQTKRNRVLRQSPKG